MNIPILNEIIRNSIGSCNLAKLNTDQVNTLYKALIDLSLKSINAAKFNKIITFLTAQQRKSIRSELKNNSKFLLGLRSFIIDSLQCNKYNKDYYNLYFKDFKDSFSFKDNIELLSILKSDIIYPKIVKNFPKQLTSKQANLLCEKELINLKKWISGFAWKKLRFLNNYNIMSQEDVINYLTMFATFTCYQSIAFKRDLRLTNSIKQGITNNGLNLIGFYKTNKRSLCINNEEGDALGLSVISENNYNNYDNSGEKESSEFDKLSLLEYTEQEHFTDFKNSLYFIEKNVEKKFGKSSLQKRVIDIILNKDKHFIKWYNDAFNESFKLTIDILESEKGNFIPIIKKYLNIKTRDFVIIIKDLKANYGDIL